MLPASTSRCSWRSSSAMSAGCRPGGRLVEQVERVPAARPLQLGGELDALRLAAAELGRRLAEPQVAEPDVAQRLEAARRRPARRRGTSAASSTVMAEHVGDVLVAVGDLEGLGVVARAVAGRARRVGAGQEEQLDRDEALALAGLAATLGDVEGEAAGAVAAGLGLVGRGEQLAHRVEQPGVGREVRPRRAADRPLVDQHQPVERLQPRHVVDVDLELASSASSGPGRGGAHQLGEHLADQRRLAGAGHAGDGGQHAERDVDGQVVAGCAGVTPRRCEPAVRGRGTSRSSGAARPKR